MIVIKALLLFLLCNSTFSQQDDPPSQACIEAQMKLNSTSQECQQAYSEISDMTDSTNTTLAEYCSPSCRAIAESIARECVSGVTYRYSIYTYYCVFVEEAVFMHLYPVDDEQGRLNLGLGVTQWSTIR